MVIDPVRLPGVVTSGPWMDRELLKGPPEQPLPVSLARLGQLDTWASSRPNSASEWPDAPFR